MPKKRIAIIGAGPSGCGVLNAFKADNQLDNYDIVCFEKQPTIGGLWNFDWHTGVGEDGEVVHSSMYRYLWSNGPKECLEYPDFTFADCYGKQIPSYPPRPVIEKYMKKRFEVPEILSRIRFQNVVRMVKYNEDNETFVIDSTDLKTKTDVKSEVFDYLFVCTGHYHNPNMIHKPGFEKFEGRLMHAHDFKDGSQFKGQTIVTIGSSYSAEDIASQCVKYGAKTAYLSARDKDPSAPWYHYNWPKNIERRSIVSKVEGNMVYFEKDEPVRADAIIVCTGYRHYYPYLEESLRLNSRDILYPGNLYKGIFWMNNTKVMYIGAQHQWFTMPQFEIQGFYARDVITGKIPLPDQAAMEADSKKWMEREDNLPDELSGIQFQGDMIADLMSQTNYFDNRFKVQTHVKNFETFVHNKCNISIMKFRDYSHIDQTTGQPSPGLNGTWMEVLDDSVEGYLKLHEDQ